MKLFKSLLLTALVGGFFVSGPAFSQTTDRLDGIQTGLAVKAPVKAASTANLTLSGQQTVGGVALVSGDRVLVKDQTDASENGIYVVNTGTWQRAADFDGNRDVANGTLVVVDKTTGQDYFYQVEATDPVVIGTSDIEFLLTNDPNVSYDITDAEISAGVTLLNSSYPPGDTRRYVNGIVDAIAVATNASADVEKQIIFGANQTISAGLSIDSGVDNVDVRSINGSILTYTGDGDAVTIGDGSSLSRNIHWDVPILRSGQDWDDGTDTTSRGLVILQADQGTFVLDIEGFNKGFNLHGTGGGNVHNDIRIRKLLDNRIQFIADRPGSNAGWNNSNWMHGGLISWRSGTMDNAADNSIIFRAIDLDHASDNELTFFGTAIEASAGSAKVANANALLIRMNGTWHSFLKGRIETNNITFAQLIRWDISAQYNVIDAGRFPTATTFANMVDDDATQKTNSIINFGNLMRYGSTRGVVSGVVQATGNPSSAQFPDGAFDANIVAGPNTSSHASKVIAARGASTSGTSGIVAGLTGTGRNAIGKDPVTAYGHDQLINATASGRFDAESVNRTTFHTETTGNTPVVVNVDSINPPAGAGTWVMMKVVCFDDDSTVGLARIRAAFIQRIGTGNLAIFDQANVYNAADGGPPDAVFSVTGTQINVTLTGIAATNLRWVGTLEWQHASVDEAFPP